MSESTQVTVTVTTGVHSGVAVTAKDGTGEVQGPEPAPLDQLAAQSGGAWSGTDDGGSRPVPQLADQSSGQGGSQRPVPGADHPEAAAGTWAETHAPVPTDLDVADETADGDGPGPSTGRKRQPKRPTPQED